jgi:hypothetical protein
MYGSPSYGAAPYGGGNPEIAFYVSVIDSLTFSESESLAPSVPLSVSDVLALDDLGAIASYDYQISVSDTVTLDDSGEISPTFHLSVSESLSLYDHADRSPDHFGVEDLLSLSEAVILNPIVSVSVSDDMTLGDTDEIAITHPIDASDTLSLSEDIDLHVTPPGIFVSDTVVLSDAPEMAIQNHISVVDTVVISDNGGVTIEELKFSPTIDTPIGEIGSMI